MFEIVEHILITDFIGHLDFYVVIFMAMWFLGSVFFRK